MTLDERIALAKDLIAKREEIDNQLAELFSGTEAGRRPYRKRKVEENGLDSNAQSAAPQSALSNGRDGAR